MECPHVFDEGAASAGGISMGLRGHTTLLVRKLMIDDQVIQNLRIAQVIDLMGPVDRNDDDRRQDHDDHNQVYPHLHRHLSEPVIAFGAPFQSKSGRTSEPRLPQAEHVKRGSMSESRTSSAQRSASSAIEWLHL
jgi:hypothetical protein